MVKVKASAPIKAPLKPRGVAKALEARAMARIPLVETRATARVILVPKDPPAAVASMPLV